MDTIRTYIENIFKSLPQTDEVIRIKTELLGDMEAKYLELREGGTSEHEAVAQVIGDFGNIEELLDELDLPKPATTQPSPAEPSVYVPEITEETVRDFLAHNTKTAKLVAVGVALIILGASFLVAMAGFTQFTPHENVFAYTGVIGLLLLVIPAVVLFIYANSFTEKYHYIEKGEFTLNPISKQTLTAEYEQKNPGSMMKVAVGAALCIFGAVLLFVITLIFGEPMTPFGVSLLLLCVMVAVLLFITAASERGAYQKLLKLGDFTPESQKDNKVIGAVASVWWPLTTCIFLIWGLGFGRWDLAWIVWPIGGILFGAFAAMYKGIRGTD